LVTEVEINSAWEMIKEHIKIWVKESQSHSELRKHRPWFNVQVGWWATGL
jgi:hypothetical protein